MNKNSTVDSINDIIDMLEQACDKMEDLNNVPFTTVKSVRSSIECAINTLEDILDEYEESSEEDECEDFNEFTDDESDELDENY